MMLLYVNVLENFVMSDHRPLKFSLQCSITLPTAPDEWVKPVEDVRLANWNACCDEQLSSCAEYLDCSLQHISVPHYLLANPCAVRDTVVIDKFYSDIISCIRKAVAVCFPSKTCKAS